MAGEVRTHYLIFKLDAADPPSAPTQGFLSMYTKGDNYLYYKDSYGTEYQLQTGSGSGSCCTIIPIDAGTEEAYRVHQGSNDYIKINTTHGAQTLTLGHPELSSLGIFFKSMDVTSISENFSIDASTATNITTKELNVSLGDGSGASVSGAKRLDVVASDVNAVWNVAAPYDYNGNYVATNDYMVGRLNIGGFSSLAEVGEGSGVERMFLRSWKYIGLMSDWVHINPKSYVNIALGSDSYEDNASDISPDTNVIKAQIISGSMTIEIGDENYAGQKTTIESEQLDIKANAITMADGATIDGLDPSALATTAGAGMIGIEDAGNNFTSTTVEGALSELAAGGGGGGGGVTPAGSSGDVQTNNGYGGLGSIGIATSESAGTSGKLLKVSSGSSINSNQLLTIDMNGELVPAEDLAAPKIAYKASVGIDTFGMVKSVASNTHHVQSINLNDQLPYSNPSAPLLSEYADLPQRNDVPNGDTNPYSTHYAIYGHANIDDANYGFSPVKLPSPENNEGLTITISYSNREDSFANPPSEKQIYIDEPTYSSGLLPPAPEQMIALIPDSDNWSNSSYFVSNQIFHSVFTSVGSQFNWPVVNAAADLTRCPAFFLAPGGSVTLSVVRSAQLGDSSTYDRPFCWQIVAHYDRYPQYVLASAAATGGTGGLV